MQPNDERRPGSSVPAAVLLVACVAAAGPGCGGAAHRNFAFQHERTAQYALRQADLLAEQAPPAPSDAGAERDLARAAAIARLETVALAEADRAVALAPDQPAPLLLRAAVLDRAGRHDDASRDRARALRVAPEDTNAQLAAAFELQQAGDVKAMTDQVESALRRRPPIPSERDYTSRLQLEHVYAIGLLQQRRYAEALQAFDLLDLHAVGAPGAILASVSAGRAVAWFGAEPDGHRATAELRRASSFDWEGAMFAAEALARAGFAQEVGALAQRLHEEHPDDVGVSLLYLDSLRRDGRLDAVRAETDRLLRMGIEGETRANVLVLAAMERLERRETDAALDFLREALDEQPGHEAALQLLGGILSQRGEEGRREFQERLDDRQLERRNPAPR